MLRYASRGFRHARIDQPSSVLSRTIKQRASALHAVPASSGPGNASSHIKDGGGMAESDNSVHRVSLKTSPLEAQKAESDGPNHEDTFATLLMSLEDHDILGAKKQWESLSSSGALKSFILVHGTSMSNTVKQISSSGFIKPMKVEELQVLEDFALELAAHGFPSGLRAIMTRYIRWLDSTNVHRLYARFRQLDGRRTTRVDGKAEVTSLIDVDEMSPRLVPTPLSTTHDEAMDHRDPLLSEMLMFAIAASALRNDFRQALQLTLQAKCQLDRAKTRRFVHILGRELPLAWKVEEFLLRAFTMQVLARPAAIAKHIHNLAQDHSALALHNVYTSIIEGLTDPNPFLTLDPNAVSDQTPIIVSPHVWSFFLTGFMHCQKLDLAEQLWDDVARLGITPDEQLWTALLEGYGHLQMPDRLVATWKLMLQQGFPPDTDSYRAIILGLFTSKRMAEALDHFQAFQGELKRGRFSSTDYGVRIVYNIVIHWLLIRSEEANALSLMEEGKRIGVTPDIFTINSFLQFYAKSTDLKGIADQLQVMDSLEITPNDHTYSILLTALLPVRKDAMAVVVEFMKKYGTTPNVAMYTTIIDNLMEERTRVAFQAALELLHAMEASEAEAMQPNVVTYTSILCGLHRNSWMDRRTTEEYTELIAEKMKKRRLLHGVISYNILIKACLENPEPDGIQAALGYYREMNRRRMALTPDTWYILLSGLDRRREWAVARTLIGDMEQTGHIAASKTLWNLVSRIKKRSAQRSNRNSYLTVN